MLLDLCGVRGAVLNMGYSADVSGKPWCICMWAYSRYVTENGCGALTLKVGATDVDGICEKLTDSGTDLTAARACLGCPSAEELADAKKQIAHTRDVRLVQSQKAAAVAGRA